MAIRVQHGAHTESIRIAERKTPDRSVSSYNFGHSGSIPPDGDPAWHSIITSKLISNRWPILRDKLITYFLWDHKSNQWTKNICIEAISRTYSHSSSEITNFEMPRYDDLLIDGYDWSGIILKHLWYFIALFLWLGQILDRRCSDCITSCSQMLYTPYGGPSMYNICWTALDSLFGIMCSLRHVITKQVIIFQEHDSSVDYILRQWRDAEVLSTLTLRWLCWTSYNYIQHRLDREGLRI